MFTQKIPLLKVGIYTLIIGMSKYECINLKSPREIVRASTVVIVVSQCHILSTEDSKRSNLRNTRHILEIFCCLFCTLTACDYERCLNYLHVCFFAALKMKIKEVKKEKGDKKLIAAQKKKKVLKQGVLKKKDLKKLALYIKNGANCPCSQLDSLGSNFLIMGRKVDQQLLLMSIYKWDKKSKELKFAIKYMKSHQCPTFHTVFQ